MAQQAQFKMTIEDAFDIEGRGTVVTGTVDRGSVSPGDEVLLRTTDAAKRVRVTGIEKFREQLPSATAGDTVGIYLSDITKADVTAGDSLVDPGARPE
jgi:elongation factor Tu